MDRSNYHAIARLQQGNWWYRARSELVGQILSQHGPFAYGLDLGCGLGGSLGLLAAHCEHWSAVEPDREAVRWCHEQGWSAVVQGDATDLVGFPEDQFDLVLCLDVLEHLDDQAALAEIRRVLRPGGLLVATVPAHGYLWNENDEFSHHLRRYSRASFETVLGDFEALDITWWNFSSYLPMLAYAGLRRLVPAKPANNLDSVPALADRPLGWALRLENHVRRFLPSPIGTSLVAVARCTGT